MIDETSGPIRFQAFGTDELLAKLNAIPGFVKSPAMRALLEDAGNAYEVLAQGSVPKQTRLLKSSINHQILGWGTNNPGLQVGAGGNGSKYAWYVETGTKASVRYARMKRFMHWYQDGNGTTLQFPFGLKTIPAGAQSIFAKRVNHPGTPAQPFFFIHFDNIKQRFITALNRLLDEALSAQGPQPTAGPSE